MEVHTTTRAVRTSRARRYRRASVSCGIQTGAEARKTPDQHWTETQNGIDGVDLHEARCLDPRRGSSRAGAITADSVGGRMAVQQSECRTLAPFGRALSDV